MPTCPSCGGTEAEQIAPGFWRCTSIPDEDPCGTEYQVGGEGPAHGTQPLCRCGTFAIGRCAECGEWICGTHSNIAHLGGDGNRLCGQHYAEAQKRWMQTEQKRQEKLRAEQAIHEEERQAREFEERRSRDRRELAVYAGVCALVLAAFLYLRSADVSAPLAVILSGGVLGFIGGGTQVVLEDLDHAQSDRKFQPSFDIFTSAIGWTPVGLLAGAIAAFAIFVLF